MGMEFLIGAVWSQLVNFLIGKEMTGFIGKQICAVLKVPIWLLKNLFSDYENVSSITCRAFENNQDVFTKHLLVVQTPAGNSTD